MSISHSKLPHLSEQDIKRFWDKVDVCAPDDCWHWTAATSKGYGTFKAPYPIRKQLRAHRIAYFLNSADDPVGYVVRHSCDNPPCCNPKHLAKGSHLDNINDAVLRGRLKVPHDATNLTRGDAHWTRTTEGRERSRLYLTTVIRARGERQHSAKMTAALVVEARTRYSDGENIFKLSRDYGISWPSMKKIIERISWAHVS